MNVQERLKHHAKLRLGYWRTTSHPPPIDDWLRFNRDMELARAREKYTDEQISQVADHLAHFGVNAADLADLDIDEFDILFWEYRFESLSSPNMTIAQYAAVPVNEHVKRWKRIRETALAMAGRRTERKLL
jgi:hypothetical protein